MTIFEMWRNEWGSSEMVPMIPHPLSRGEETFAFHCRVHGLSPVREFVFHPTRKWRLDFCWPHLKLAVEIEGGVHRIKGRFKSDLAKYNALALDGWRLLRYSPKMVESGEAINEVMIAIGSTEPV